MAEKKPAKGTRAPVRIDPFRAPQIEIRIATVTNFVPTGPRKVCTALVATGLAALEPAISVMGSA